MLTDTQKNLEILSRPTPGPPPNLSTVLKDHASAVKTKSWGPKEANAELSRWYAKYPNHLLPAHLKVPRDFDEKTGNHVRSTIGTGLIVLLAWSALLMPAGNFGLRTSGFPVGDIDCPNPRVADAVEAAIAAEVKQPLSVRFRSNSPKRSILFALKPGALVFRKKRIEAVDERGDPQVVEVLADGQQSIVIGLHPSGVVHEYRGPHPADIGPEGLPQIDGAGAQRLLAAIREAMVRAGCTIRNESAAAQVEIGRRRKKIGDPSLMAPSLRTPRGGSQLFRNTPENLPSHNDFVAFAAAKAACGGDEDFYANMFGAVGARIPQVLLTNTYATGGIASRMLSTAGTLF